MTSHERPRLPRYLLRRKGPSSSIPLAALPALPSSAEAASADLSWVLDLDVIHLRYTAPCPPCSPYLFFCLDQKANVHASLSETTERQNPIAGIHRLLRLWNTRSDAQKAAYVAKAMWDRERYNREMEAWKEGLARQGGKKGVSEGEWVGGHCHLRAIMDAASPSVLGKNTGREGGGGEEDEGSLSLFACAKAGDLRNLQRILSQEDRKKGKARGKGKEAEMEGNINARDNEEGLSPLMAAALCSDYATIDLLLSACPPSSTSPSIASPSSSSLCAPEAKTPYRDLPKDGKREAKGGQEGGPDEGGGRRGKGGVVEGEDPLPYTPDQLYRITPIHVAALKDPSMLLSLLDLHTDPSEWEAPEARGASRQGREEEGGERAGGSGGVRMTREAQKGATIDSTDVMKAGREGGESGGEEDGKVRLPRLINPFAARLSALDGDGRTPLHYACMGGNPLCVALLLERSGGEECRVDRWGLTPLALAAQERVPEVVQIETLFTRWARGGGKEGGRETGSGEGGNGGREGLMLRREVRGSEGGGLKRGEGGKEGGREGGREGTSGVVGSLASWVLGRASHVTPSFGDGAHGGEGGRQGNDNASSDATGDDAARGQAGSTPSLVFSSSFSVWETPLVPPSGAGKEAGREGEKAVVETAVWCDFLGEKKEREATRRRLEEEREMVEAMVRTRTAQSSKPVSREEGKGEEKERSKEREKRGKERTRRSWCTQMSAEEDVEGGGEEGRLWVDQGGELEHMGDRNEGGHLIVNREEGGGGGGIMRIWTQRGAAAAAVALLLTCVFAIPVWL